MIRLASLNDLDSIVKLELDTLNTTLGIDMLKDSLNNDMSYIYVIEDNGIIGYISLYFDMFDAEILNFCISRNYQNNKLGTRLLEYVINEFKGKKAESFILEVRESNLRAIHLYEKLGFKRISIRKSYYSNGENALVLKLEFKGE